MGKTKVTMLSGFLGAGKTTLLRNLLENSTERIACIVNDVASINIDAKLVRNDRNRGRNSSANTTSDLADTIELQNGCACCSLQDELFVSFEQVLALGDKRGQPYARIVLENSGVAEPQNLRDKFSESAASGMPVMERLELDTLVTVVDAASFIKDYASKAPLASRPELGEGGTLRPVVDLLVEQVECADFVVLNKTDLLQGSEQLEQLVSIVSMFNPLATVIPCERGKVPIETVFGSCAHGVMARLNVEGQHRGAVAAAKAIKDSAELHAHKHAHEGEHAHGHKHSHAEDGHAHGDDKACDHEHAHTHEHGHAHTHEHKHSHAEDGHVHEDVKAVGHDHGHDHAHHDHAHHDHAHHHHEGERPATTAAKRFGIHSFVYCRRRPFHPQRLKEMVLKWLPVTHNQAIDGDAPEVGESPIKTVLRSKGFMWMSNSHTTAYYWSHAGQHFEIRDEGDWWVAVPDEEWPLDDAQREVVLQDFDTSGTQGDRRQEIVFIGVGMDEDRIVAQMDGALLSDDEMEKYVQRWSSHADPEHRSLEQLRKKAKAV